MLALRSLPAGCAARREASECTACGARAFAVCRTLDAPDLDRLDALADRLTVPAGASLIRDGDPARHVFSITSGCVRVLKLLPDGRRQITGFLFAGDFMGLSSGDAYVFAAEAVEPVSVCRFPRTAFREMMRESPALEHALLERATHELAAAQNQMILLGRKTAQERLASFLLDLPDRDPARPPVPGHVRLPMTRSEIADYLGLTIETVSRVLTKLKTQGLIRLVSMHELLILDPERLRALADGMGDRLD